MKVEEESSSSADEVLVESYYFLSTFIAIYLPSDVY
jgi:hypothetical protein